MKKKVLLILAEGFEEVEAVTPMDVLRRAGIEVTVAGLSGTDIKGAHGVTVHADTVLGSYNGAPDAVVLPGGMPGAENLARSSMARDIIKDTDKRGKIIAAICASPALVLAPLGILDRKKATCYPGMEGNFSAGIRSVKANVVQDGNVITSMGPATALPFALKIVENLVSKEMADSVGKAMLFC